MQITHAARGWVAIRPDEESDPQIVAASGFAEKETPALPPEGDPLAAAVAGGAVAVRAGNPTLAAGMLAPVVREGKTVGLVLVERPEPDFSGTEREALERLADHAAAAAENTRLFQRLRRANDAKSQFVSIVSHELENPDDLDPRIRRPAETGVDRSGEREAA